LNARIAPATRRRSGDLRTARSGPRLRSATGCLLAVLAAACGKERPAAPPATAQSAPAPDTADAGPWCELADSSVEAAIASVARQRDRDEYCEYRHYAVDDIDGDSSDDFVVTFNLEGASGGTDTESYLMVFLSSREGRAPLLLEIDNIGGDYGERYPTDVTVDGRYVVVDFSEYRSGDPDCCPSGSSSARFLVTGDRIVERARPSERAPGSGARSS